MISSDFLLKVIHFANFGLQVYFKAMISHVK